MLALQLSADGSTVVNTIVVDEAADPSDFGAVAASNDEVGIGWVSDGAGGWVAPAAAKTPAEIKAALTTAVQAHVDDVAKSRGYNDGASCVGYATSTVAGWAAEAAAFGAWRDAVWSSALATLAAVTAGSASVPTAADLIDGLPVMTWPAA